MQEILVILLGLLSTVGGQGYTFCTVPQWEGVRDSLDSQYNGHSDPDVLVTRSQISYDLNNTRVALKALHIDGHEDQRPDYIYDYSKEVLYTIKQSQCTKTHLFATFPKWCTPEEAVMTWGKTWLGGAGPNEVLWILGFTGSVKDINYHASFSQFHLVPVFETFSGHINGVPFFSTSNFMNVSVGITDPSVFIPPASCNGVPLQSTNNTRQTYGVLPL